LTLAHLFTTKVLFLKYKTIRWIAMLIENINPEK